MILENFTIKTRLLASFALVLSLMLGMIGFNFVDGQHATRQLQELVDHEMRKYELIAAIDSATKDNARRTLSLFIVEPEKRAEIKQQMGEAKLVIDELFKQLEPMIKRPEGKALFAEMREKRGAFVQAFTAAAQAQAAGDETRALGLVRTMVTPALEALKKPVSGLLVLQKNIADERVREIEQANDRQNQVNLSLGALIVLMCVGTAFTMIRSIMVPIGVAKQVAAEIAKGNLDVDFEVRGKNELADMLRSMHVMKEFLVGVVKSIQDSAMQVATASSEIAAANMDLSSRTESQASSLQQTAAAMEQMTSTVQSNSEITQSASSLTSQVSVSANEVGSLVGNVVTTMEDIHASSRQIHDIIGVIDSIAFQTNILALNAAVEAARAGEQGRGFAVVASEVRSLAQRSAAAAHEIKTIIQGNVTKITTGNELASRAGGAIVKVLASIQTVTASIADVALATREQSVGIGQVGQAVTQLDEATQQNAALVEQTAAASSKLHDQVQELENTIHRFSIGQRSAAVARYPALA